MKHTELALRRPVTTIVVFVALALVGLIATRMLPLEKFPDIEFPGIIIQVPYAGSTPEEVERLITRPIEEALATLSGVERMFSSSSENQAQIFLQFDWGQSMGAKGIEARAKVDSIRHDLPDDIRMPGLRGSIVGGVAMIAIGVVILSNTAYDIPLDWLENWWPAGVVIFGVYLVVKGVMERGELGQR